MPRNEISTSESTFDLFTSRAWQERRRSEHWHAGYLLQDIELLKREAETGRIEHLPRRVALCYLESRIRKPYEAMPEDLLWVLLLLDPNQAEEVVQLASLLSAVVERIRTLTHVAEWCRLLGRSDIGRSALDKAIALYLLTNESEYEDEWQYGILGGQFCQILAKFGEIDEELLNTVRQGIDAKASRSRDEDVASSAAHMVWSWAVEKMAAYLAAAGEIEKARELGIRFFGHWYPDATKEYSNAFQVQLIHGALNGRQYEAAEAILSDLGMSKEAADGWQLYFRTLVERGEEERFKRAWHKNGQRLVASLPETSRWNQDAHARFSKLAKERKTDFLKWKAEGGEADVCRSYVWDQFEAHLWRHQFVEASHSLRLYSALEKGEMKGLPASSELSLARAVSYSRLQADYRPSVSGSFGTWQGGANRIGKSVAYSLLVLGQTDLLTQLSTLSELSMLNRYTRPYISALTSLAADLANASSIHSRDDLDSWLVSSKSEDAKEVATAYTVFKLALRGERKSAEMIMLEAPDSQQPRMQRSLAHGLALTEGAEKARDYVRTTCEDVMRQDYAGDIWLVSQVFSVFGNVDAVESLLLEDLHDHPGRNHAWIDWAGPLSTRLSPAQMAVKLHPVGWKLAGTVAMNLATVDVTYARNFLMSTFALSENPEWGEDLPSEFHVEEESFVARVLGIAGPELPRKPLLRAIKYAELLRTCLAGLGDGIVLTDFNENSATIAGFRFRREILHESEVKEVLDTLDNLERHITDRVGTDAIDELVEFHALRLASCIFCFPFAPDLCRSSLANLAQYALASPLPWPPFIVTGLAWGLALSGSVAEAMALLHTLTERWTAKNQRYAYWFRDELLRRARKQILVASPHGEARAQDLERVLDETKEIENLLQLLLLIGNQNDENNAETVLKRILELMPRVVIQSAGDHTLQEYETGYLAEGSGAEVPAGQGVNYKPRRRELEDESPECEDDGKATTSPAEDDKLKLDEDFFGSMCVFLILAQRTEWVTILIDSLSGDHETLALLRRLIVVGTDSPEGSQIVEDMLGADWADMSLNDEIKEVKEEEEAEIEEGWPHHNVLKSASTVTDIEGLWSVSQLVQRVGDSSVRTRLLVTSASRFPSDTLPQLISSLVDQQEPERRFEQAIWLGAIANGLSVAPPEAIKTVTDPRDLFAKSLAVLSEFMRGQMGWSRIEVWGKSMSPAMAHTWGLALLLRCITSDEFATERLAIEAQVTANIYDSLRLGSWSGNWNRYSSFAGLQEVLETVGGEELIEAIGEEIARMGLRWMAEPRALKSKETKVASPEEAIQAPEIKRALRGQEADTLGFSAEEMEDIVS